MHLGSGVGTLLVVDNKAAGIGQQKFLCECTATFATATASAAFKATNGK